MNAFELLPVVRELFSRHPEYRYHEAWELVHVLFSLGYTNELEEEMLVLAAARLARRDSDPEEDEAA